MFGQNLNSYSCDSDFSGMLPSENPALLLGNQLKDSTIFSAGKGPYPRSCLPYHLDRFPFLPKVEVGDPDFILSGYRCEVRLALIYRGPVFLAASAALSGSGIANQDALELGGFSIRSVQLFSIRIFTSLFECCRP